jgi:hypothetical protein
MIEITIINPIFTGLVVLLVLSATFFVGMYWGLEVSNRIYERHIKNNIHNKSGE